MLAALSVTSPVNMQDHAEVRPAPFYLRSSTATSHYGNGAGCGGYPLLSRF